jgi:hypothetical protein
MGIKHTKVTALADDPAYDVSSNEWNDDHTIDDASIAIAKLSDHNKAANDALDIDADTLDGNDSTAFAVATKGVTNGDAHDHSGGDGAQITTQLKELLVQMAKYTGNLDLEKSTLEKLNRALDTV